MRALLLVRCGPSHPTKPLLLGPGSISGDNPNRRSGLHEVNVSGLDNFFHYVRPHAPLLGQFADVTASDRLSLGQITNLGSGDRGFPACLAREQPAQLERLALER